MENDASKKTIFTYKNVFKNSLRTKQHFLIPENIIYYISMNPKSTKVYQKLIQTCKYFFIKNPIIIAEYLWLGQSYEECEVINHAIYERKIFDIKKLSSKIWITSRLTIGTFSSKSISKSTYNALVSKLYRCDIIYFNIYNQYLSFEEFEAFSSSGFIKNFALEESTIRYFNGKFVPLEIIFESLPKLEIAKIHNIYQLITSETALKLTQLPNISKLERFSINNLPEIFDIVTYFANLKEPRKTRFNFDFIDSISENYKEKLQKFVDEIISNGLTENYPPRIVFPGQNFLSKKALFKLQREWADHQYQKKYGRKRKIMF